MLPEIFEALTTVVVGNVLRSLDGRDMPIKQRDTLYERMLFNTRESQGIFHGY